MNLRRLIEIQAIHDMRKLLNSKRRKPMGQDLVYHLQVLEFLQFQRLGHGLRKLFWKRTRMDAAAIVAATGGSGERGRNRIIKNEKSWVKSRTIPLSNQGKS